MFNLIDGPVGPGEENDPDNLRILWSGLNALDGAYRDPDTFPPLITAEFDVATRTFQAQNGLFEDGRWLPGGESERNLIARLTGEGLDRIRPSEVRLRGSIGESGENRREDIVTGKRIFASLGEYVHDRTRLPSPYVDVRLVDVIREFQRRFELPVTGRIDLDSEELRLLGLEIEDLEDRSREEIKIAALPLFALILAGVRLGMRAGSVIAARRAGNVAVIRALEKAQRDVGSELATAGVLESARRARKQNPFTATEAPIGVSLPDIPPIVEELSGNTTPAPPTPPDLNRRPDHQNVPEEELMLPPRFPLPQNPEDLVEIFPANGREFSIGIVERRGNERTQSLNELVAREIERIAKKCGIKVNHTHGARNDQGGYLQEKYIKNRDTNGLKGSNFLDLTFAVGSGSDRPDLHLNTTDHLADGYNPTTRERRAADRALHNKETKDYLVLVPKIPEGTTLNVEELEALVKPILEAMAGRPEKANLSEKPAPDVYHLLKKPRADAWWFATA